MMADAEDEEEPLTEIAERWEDGEDEYYVLRDLVLPEARERFYSVMHDWAALDTKALGVFAVDAAALGVLIAVHHDVNHLWEVPGVLFAVAGGLIIAVIWVRGIALGPDLLDFHNKMRDDAPLGAARQMLSDVVGATEENDETLNGKTTLFWWALALLALALVTCLPIALLRPS
jgi:hypothetical protein